jgi:hypothetical protein
VRITNADAAGRQVRTVLCNGVAVPNVTAFDIAEGYVDYLVRTSVGNFPHRRRGTITVAWVNEPEEPARKAPGLRLER